MHFYVNFIVFTSSLASRYQKEEKKLRTKIIYSHACVQQLNVFYSETIENDRKIKTFQITNGNYFERENNSACPARQNEIRKSDFFFLI